MADQALNVNPNIGKRVKTAPGEAQRYFYETVLPYEGDECLLWPYGRDWWGYGHVGLNGRSAHTHRLLCELVNGPPPTPQHHAAHSCGKGHLGCVTKGHLSWKTPKENKADELIHGTRNRGHRNGFVKLTEAEAAAVWSLKHKMTQRAIARSFGVGQTTVRDIHDKKTWAWLTQEQAA